MSLLLLHTQKMILKDFEVFRTRIEPSEKQKESISSSHLKMRGILENSKEIHVVETFLTGSYARQTMIRPLRDVDYFVKVHYTYHKNDSPIQILRKITRILQKAYPYSRISIRPPCVTIRFAFCHFEIVPAIGIEGNEELFKIPANNGRGWQYTYPKIPDKWMIQENKVAGGLFKPTIKMIKRWRDIHKVPLRSFHLEMLARMAFNSYKIENFVQGVWAFLKNTTYLLNYNQYTPFIEEPGRKNVYVDKYLFDDRLKLAFVKKKLYFAHRHAEKSFDYMSKGRTRSAERLWRNILGPEFPVQTTTTAPLHTISRQTLKSIPFIFHHNNL